MSCWQLIHDSAELKDVHIPVAGLAGASDVLAAHFPPTLKDFVLEVQEIYKRSAATPFAGFFVAYDILLHRYSDQPSFVVCTAVMQRDLSMLTNVVGFFANMLPIKTVTDETKTFAEYLGQLKQSPMVCLSHDEVTYEDIVAQAKSSSSQPSVLHCASQT
ncbi:hypothetical protein BU15DRAFT_77543 [Melanogaster broomeanus]|nr:hypothetical protein BU15DRAFT_77543 [Melanogaster broomeanus]